MKRWLGRAVIALAIALGFGAPVAATAVVPAAIDPACDEFRIGGFLTVLDPAEAAAGLPPSASPK